MASVSWAVVLEGGADAAEHLIKILPDLVKELDFWGECAR
jgi:hypothetical protein